MEMNKFSAFSKLGRWNERNLVVGVTFGERMTLRIPVQQKRFVRGGEAPDAERSIKALGRTMGLTRFASRSEKRVLMFLTTARPPRPDTRMEDCGFTNEAS